MRKLTVILLMLVLAGCSSESAPDCFQTSGELIRKTAEVAPFSEIMVFERVKLFIEQGDVQKVVIESGKNILSDVSAEVVDGRLILRNENACNLFRNYEVTKVYVTTPDLEWVQSSTGSAIESIGTLKFKDLWLRSLNQEKDPDIHSNGDFILELDVENLRITSDHLSNYFLTGKVENFNAFFAAGDGRLEARNLIVQHYDVFHRGTNKLIVNPLQSLRGHIYSYGDIISVNRPPVVDVTEHFKGRLIFE
ncbi:head GIN domain-containing protein [Christiangramia salexigens]|uniref:DUF2807 domain-containing protein n=1 Tax=Christiangramia salexigens TaxID=1913577 RepID=A0A1L3J584_9FLAO|nr:head GIN domain-containing protein [Christiangramia salexigens]APG60272.1 DUF2807 domain-containing protein [Christiangramia salexigens]